METVAILTGVAAGAVLFIYLGAGVLARLREEPAAEWTVDELDEAAHPAEPLTRDISPVELAPAYLFDEIAAARPIQIDWQPPTFSQTWRIAGERMADLGDTQQIERVEVPA
jgi:hypothetical protein